MTGACCIDDVCVVTTAAECAAMAGVCQGDGTNCDPNPCIVREQQHCFCRASSLSCLAAGPAPAGPLPQARLSRWNGEIGPGTSVESGPG